MRQHRNTPQRKLATQDYSSIADLKRLAQGRWRSILEAAGIPAESLAGNRGRPCPRCGGRDRFAPMRDFDSRGAVLCRHCHNAQTDPKCGDGIATLAWWLGSGPGPAIAWLQSYLGLRDGQHRPRCVPRPIPQASTSTAISMADIERFERIGSDCMARWSDAHRIHCAERLGLPASVLSRLEVGWSPAHRATTWPMRDADGRIIGIRLRCPETARKWAVMGSHAGLIYDPRAMRERAQGGRLWIVEGPTDTAALASLDLDAIGVPSAGGARGLLSAFARRMRPSEMVIVADADVAGRRGAESLREALILISPIRMIAPPSGIKDARQWVTSGASRSTIESVADASRLDRIELSGGAS